LVDPDIQTVLYAAARSRAPSYRDIGPQAARALYERTAPVLDVAPTQLALVDEWPVEATAPAAHLQDRAGHVLKVRRYCPAMPSWALLQPALLYFHGGGFVIGSLDTHDRLCRRLASLSNCMVLSVDYRLAPEHRFPCAVDDAFATLAWLMREAPSLGIDPDRIAVGGDSAGGTLAAACAIHARDQGWGLALQLLLYPGLSPDQDTESHRRLAHGYLLEAPLIEWFFSHYLRGAGDRVDWRFAPLVHPDLRGVAPAWIALAQYDPLLDEGRCYCERLRQAGVEVEGRLFEGMIHSFLQFGGLVGKAREAHREVAAVVQGHLEPEQP
jgi:acetyl esterase